MRLLMSLIFLVTPSAHAFQFGTGMAPGMQCPYPYGPSNAAYQGNDEVRNLVGGLANTERQLERKEQQLRKLNEDINAAKAKIRLIIKSPTAIADIERHYKYKANPGDYSQACGLRERAEPTASAGGPGANVVNRPARGAPVAGSEDPGRYAVPSAYCQGGVNDWQHVVAEGGMVSPLICEYEVPLSRNLPDPQRVQDCRDGLDAYYARQAKREILEAEMRVLREKRNRYDDDRERIEDQIAEGTYCPYCNSQRRGQNTLGTGNFAMMGVSILGALFNRQQPPRPQPVLVAVPRRGPGGPMPYGGSPVPMPFPGPAAYPGRPYAASARGYYGVQPGIGRGQSYYGGVPGAIGPGAFGCQGTSPYGFGNPLAAQFDPFNNSRWNPFANPYDNDPFAQYGQNAWDQYPFGGHPLLNPGYGPGIQPILGNGSYDPYNQFDQYDPYGQNQLSALGVRPFWGQGGQPQPFGSYNPNPPYGRPYGGPGLPVRPFNGAVGGPQQYFGGGAFPYVNSMVSNGSYSNPWAAPYNFNPVQNYGYQMGLLRQGITQIGGGQYGGSFAPPVLPPVPSVGGGGGAARPVGPIMPVGQPQRTPVNGAPPVASPVR